MKYSDPRRIEKMAETTQKLLDYLRGEGITREVILAQEPVRWTITTPLYNINIGEQASQLTNCL